MIERRYAWPFAAVLAIWACFSLQLVAGSRTLFLRDAFSVHFPLKAYGAAELAHGRVPAFFDRWGLGVPFRGNPQALAFYPGNVFYLLLPFWSAFNVHFVLHWLIAFLAMRVLARTLGQGEGGALVAALAYAGGGIVLSALSFYNLLVVLAWWPAVMAAAVRGGRRGVAWGGLFCGLALLGGEPVSLAIAGLPLALAAFEAHGARRGAAHLAAIAALGALVALPQLVATARILPFTFRAAHGIEAGQAAAYALHPLRLLELLVPLPWGWPARAGASGWWAHRIVPRPPFFFSLYVGAVALGLALAGARARRAWGWLGAAPILAAWLGGEAGGILAHLSAGLFRYPEKFLVAAALSLALLAGWGFEPVLSRGKTRAWWIAATLSAIAALGIAAVRLLASGLAGPLRGLLLVQSSRWASYLGIAALLLGGAGWCIRRRSGPGLVALQLAGLLQLWPLAPRVETAPLSAPPLWAARLSPRATVHSPAWASPRWQPLEAGPRTLAELAAALDPAPGVLHGFAYPLAPDFEGLASPLHTLLQRNLAGLRWAARVRWMQIAGVDRAVLFSPVDRSDLELLDRRPADGYEALLYAVREAAPRAFWPRRVVVAASPVEALAAVPALESAAGEAVATHSVLQGEGTVGLRAEEPDRVELEVEGTGGLAVVQRAYHPLWRARIDDRPASVEPVDLILSGVEVPPGAHRVVLDVAAWPEIVASGLALSTALGLVALGWPKRRRTA